MSTPVFSSLFEDISKKRKRPNTENKSENNTKRIKLNNGNKGNNEKANGKKGKNKDKGIDNKGNNQANNNKKGKNNENANNDRKEVKNKGSVNENANVKGKNNRKDKGLENKESKGNSKGNNNEKANGKKGKNKDKGIDNKGEKEKFNFENEKELKMLSSELIGIVSKFNGEESDGESISISGDIYDEEEFKEYFLQNTQEFSHAVDYPTDNTQSTTIKKTSENKKPRPNGNPQPNDKHPTIKKPPNNKPQQNDNPQLHISKIRFTAFVGGLTNDGVTTEQLNNYFNGCGPIADIKLLKNNNGGSQVAMIYFKTPAGFDKAKEKNGNRFNGMPIEVCHASEKVNLLGKLL